MGIVENRQLKYLKKYFSRYRKNVRNKVKYIVMDMYKPYIYLVKKIFPKTYYLVQNYTICTIC
ncbi:MAG: transposase [Lachnospirales bacterium]